MYKLLIPLSFLILSCSEQDSEETLSSNMKKHVEYLASDELAGRETGTEGESKAAEYIAKQFESFGIEAKGSDGYFQEFEFLSGKEFGDNKLVIDDNELLFNEEYFVMNFSGNGEIDAEIVDVSFGISAPKLDYDNFEDANSLQGKIALMDVSSPDGIHPHSKYKAYHDLRNRVNNAKDKGALAVIFHNPGALAESPNRNYSRKITEVEIPVLFVTKSEGLSNNNSAQLKVEMNDEFKKGKNVVAFIDKRSAHTVVIGAHYDHLGYGDDGSLFRGKGKEIHNGADDNASGTAILMELARTLNQKPELDQNFLFIAFSGEEKGLLGSAYFTDEPTIELDEVNYMINMDMVGRLDSSNNLTVFGIGTSPIWDSLVDLSSVKGDLNIIEKPDGVGPSDHTSFYLENIPVLHLFTGAHSDYHKPTDDADKINYIGMYDVYNYVLNIVESLKGEKLAFTKTKDGDNQNAPRFSVTLGVVPDYAFSGKGMRIDGVSDDKPASRSGIKKGDVVIRMGEMEVVDMMAYMTALSMFKKGDSTRVVVKRGAEQVDVQVIF